MIIAKGDTENIKIDTIDISFGDDEYIKMESVNMLLNRKYNNENIAKFYGSISSIENESRKAEHYQFLIKDALLSKEELESAVKKIKIRITYSEDDGMVIQRVINLKNVI